MLWRPVNQDSQIQPRGSVLRGGSTPNHVVMAQANSSQSCTNLVGVRTEDVNSGETGSVQPFNNATFVRLVAEPAINDTIYLSDVSAGSGTNIAPTIKVPLGVIYEKTQINGIWYGLIIPIGSILGERNTSSSSFASPSTREVHVGNVANAYPTIEAALAAIDLLSPPASGLNPVAVIVHPGSYTPPGTLTIKAGVGILGIDGGAVSISGAFDIFSIAGDNTFFANFHSLAANAPNSCIFRCNNYSYINIYNVGQWRNGGNVQKYLVQSGSNWRQLSMGNCLIDSLCSASYACSFDSVSARYVDVEIGDCFVDTWAAGSSGGCFSINACQDFRFFKSKIRSTTSGKGITLTGTGAWVEMQCVAGIKADGGYGALLNAGAGTSARVAYCDGVYEGSGTITVLSGPQGPTGAAGSPGPIGPQGPGGPASGLTTAYDIDLSTLTPASYNTDGVKTIDGRAAWRLKNSANGQLIALNDGSHAGLYTRCSTFNSVNYGTNYNGPRWVIGLTDLCGISQRDCLEQWVLFMFSQPHTPNANNENCYLGISALPGADTDTNHSIPTFDMARGYSSGLQTFALWQKTTTVTVGPAGTTFPLTTDDVYAFRILADATIEAYSGASVANEFPSVSSLRFVGKVSYMTQGQGYFIDQPFISQNFQWAAIMSIAQSNTIGASDLLLKKLRVLYR